MKLKKSSASALCLITYSIIISFNSYAEIFKCDFSHKPSRHNTASCANNPSEAFNSRATGINHYPPFKHCENADSIEYRDKKNVFINLTTEKASWDTHEGIRVHQKNKMKRTYMRDPQYTEQLADEIVSEIKKTTINLDVVSYSKTLDTRFHDPLTGEYLRDSVKTPIHHIVLSGGLLLNSKYLYTNSYYLSIDEAINEAVLTQTGSNSNASWIGISFGKCKKL